MFDTLIHGLVFTGQVLLVWTILALLVCMVWAGYARNRDRQRQREQEALSAAWDRMHGGDPEYGGNLRGRAP